jgi:hypothetical protein
MAKEGHAFADFPATEAKVSHAAYADSFPQVSASSAADNSNRNSAVGYQPTQNLPRRTAQLNIFWPAMQRSQCTVEIQKKQKVLCAPYEG